MKKRPSSPSDSECLETFVRTLVESSQMSADEMLELTSRLSGASPSEIQRCMNSNSFQADEVTLSDLISEAVLNKTPSSKEK